MNTRSIFFSLLLFCNLHLFAQQPSTKSSSELHLDLQKLNFLGRVMFVAAHPDDENTRLISYLTHQLHAKTAYLAMTRGDGGQNLIGTEIRELLGVLRTEELKKARSIDGGEQYFTRAIDFGYSKHPDETLRIWDKQELLTDIIDRIRLFKPDVIINRFDHRSPGSTHGHHTTSAILSVEAFDLIDNTELFPLRTATESWKPKRLFFNTSWWFYGSAEKFEEANQDNLLKYDVGVYYPSLGISNNEIASIASSQHLCQGFGRRLQRGSENEYLELIKGSKLSTGDLFEGIDTSWNRIKGGRAIEQLLKPLEKNFNYADPSTHTPVLLEAYTLLNKLEDSFWKREKTKELVDFILAINGIFIEANATKAFTNPGSDVEFILEAINRSNNLVSIQKVESNYQTASSIKGFSLENNQKTSTKLRIHIDKETPYNTPYWLDKSTDGIGMYSTNNTDFIGLPNTPNPIKFKILLTINGVAIPIERTAVHRTSKPDKGELLTNFSVLPKISLEFKDQVSLFTDLHPKTIQVEVKALSNSIDGEVYLEIPDSWSIEPKKHIFDFESQGESQLFSFKLTPSKTQGSYTIKAKAKIDNQIFDKQHIVIDYDHIPKQDVLLPASFKAVKLSIEKRGERIAYIMGAGDQIPESLEQIGYQVDLISIESITSELLEAYDAVVLGIRAYNVYPELKTKQAILLDYVYKGGTMITQYNTSGRSGLDLSDVSPYSLQLSRDRVAEENAEVRFLLPKHPVLNYPNKITEGDFDNWVQERGLYFPNQWDSKFAAPLEMNDLGETPKQGSLLIAPYGKGTYIYTGISFFRELPAGVAGAYKLFANLLSQNNN